MKQLIFKLPTGLHRSLRMHTAMSDTTIKAFIVDLVQQYLCGDIGDSDLVLDDGTASSKPFTLHVDEALHEQIKLACENKNMSFSKLLVGLVRYGLKDRIEFSKICKNEAEKVRKSIGLSLGEAYIRYSDDNKKV